MIHAFNRAMFVSCQWGKPERSPREAMNVSAYALREWTYVVMRTYVRDDLYLICSKHHCGKFIARLRIGPDNTMNLPVPEDI